MKEWMGFFYLKVFLYNNPCFKKNVTSFYVEKACYKLLKALTFYGASLSKGRILWDVSWCLRIRISVIIRLVNHYGERFFTTVKILFCKLLSPSNHCNKSGPDLKLGQIKLKRNARRSMNQFLEQVVKNRSPISSSAIEAITNFSDSQSSDFLWVVESDSSHQLF